MEALEWDTLAERSAYLDETCGGNAAMRQRIEALLRSHDHPGSFLGKRAPARLVENEATPEGGLSRPETPPCEAGTSLTSANRR